MATRQTSRKSPRPVTASPTSKPPRTRTAAASRVGASRSEVVDAAPSDEKIASPGSPGKPTASKAAAGGRPAAARPAAVARPATTPRPGSPVSRALFLIRRVLDPVSRPVGRALAASVRWSGGGLPFATMLISLLGLADSSFLTYQHFTEGTGFAGCAEHGAVNCVAVTTSIWSRVPAGTSGGIPVSVLGLSFFVFMVAVNSRWGWRAPWPAVHWARLASVVVGIVFVLYLVWAELFRISAICLYCTGVHILTFILFVIILTRVVMSGVRGVGAPQPE